MSKVAEKNEVINENVEVNNSSKKSKKLKADSTGKKSEKEKVEKASASGNSGKTKSKKVEVSGENKKTESKKISNSESSEKTSSEKSTSNLKKASEKKELKNENTKNIEKTNTEKKKSAKIAKESTSKNKNLSTSKSSNKNLKTAQKTKQKKNDEKLKIIDDDLDDEKLEIIDVNDEKSENNKDSKIIDDEDENQKNEQSNENKYDTVSLKEIREAIENKVDKKQKKSVIKKVLINFGIGIAMIIFLILVIMGNKNISADVLEKDMKIMTLFILGIGIFTLELAYQKDKTEIVINAIEILIFGAANLCLIYIFKLYIGQLMYATIGIGATVIGYYVLKSIIMSIISVRKFKKDNSDIKEIVEKKVI